MAALYENNRLFIVGLLFCAWVAVINADVKIPKPIEGAEMVRTRKYSTLA